MNGKMDAAEVAERMMEILPDSRHWTKGNLRKYGRLCLWGARAVAAGIVIRAGMTEEDIERLLGDDEYMIAVADVILENYPDRHDPHYQVIVGFNDHDDTRFTDVRAILEKAAARVTEPGRPATTGSAGRRDG